MTVKRYVPWCVDRLTLTCSVEELPDAGLGVKVAVAPEGRPLIVKVTGELNPPVRVIVTVYVAIPPARGTTTDDGLIESE